MDLLIKHAVENVWCSPKQDRQYITRPKRISRYGGEVVQIELDWLNVYLPDNLNYYHVYQIGHLHPDYLGLFPVKNQWVSFSRVMNQMGMVCDLYTVKGTLLPKFECYYMVTTANNLIVATRKRERELKVDYNTEDIYFRVYTNAYFQSHRSNGITDRIYTEGNIPVRPEDVLAIQTRYLAYKNKPSGYSWVVINGQMHLDITPFNCKVGDLVDFVYDSSIKRVVEFPIKDMVGFDSILDNQRKYILHYPGTSDQIDYKDDLELFIIDKSSTGMISGVYHHQNTEKALRMITHRDYALNAQIVDSFVDSHPTWTDPKALFVLMFIRESGFNRSLVFENNRIHELYKLNSQDIVPAMTGEYSAVPSWKPEHLENAMYPKLMGYKEFTDFTRGRVQSAYGYNAISKIIGDTPVRINSINGVRLIQVPHAYQDNATIFEYDQNGVLLGWNYHSGGAGFVVNFTNSKLAEVMKGQGNQFLDEVYDNRLQPINPIYNYRMYICDKIGGISQENWRDVTNSGLYSLVNNIVTWLVNMNNFSTLVRSDQHGILYPLSVESKSGVMEFNLQKLQLRNGSFGIARFDVPLGELDLILNGRSLIEGIDYIVQFPKVVIINKKYLVNPQVNNQTLAVRYSGFCKSDLTMEKDVDKGFVKWELLSRNSTFNIRDDRVIRIVADGRVYHRDDVKFSEEDQAYLIPNAKNGTPYSVRDTMVSMKEFTDGDSYQLREASRVIDKSISDYLTMKLPEPTPSTPNVINERYPLYSPFLSKVIHDVVNGTIDVDESMNVYPESYVRTKCNTLEYLLAFDPTQSVNTIDPDYVIIHPVYHNNITSISLQKYNFIQTVNQIYTGNSVVLNHFFQLT